MADDDADRVITYIVGKLVNAAWIVAWFIARTMFYLVIFFVLLLGEGVLALTRRGSHPAGAGEYSPDGLYWNDRTSGKRYEVHPTKKEYCEVQGAERGQHLRQTALSRFMHQPAILRCQFAAIIDGTERVAGSVTFPRHARRGIRHLDDLDPETAGPETANWNDPLVWVGDPAEAGNALASLESILGARGWKRVGYPDAPHWYSRRYKRPAVLWDHPLEIPPDPGTVETAPDPGTAG